MGLEDLLPETREQPPELREAQTDRPAEFPPKLERDAEPILGESFDARIARHKLESAIEHGREIDAEHRLRDYKKVLEREQK